MFLGNVSVYIRTIDMYIWTTNIYALCILYICIIFFWWGGWKGFFVVHDLTLHNQKSMKKDLNNRSKNNYKEG